MEELARNITKAFKDAFYNDKAIKDIYLKIEKGTASYKDAYRFAQRVGNIRAKVLKSKLSTAYGSEDKIPFEVANEILSESCGTNFALISKVSDDCQSLINQNAGIGLKTISAEYDTEKVNGFVRRLSDEIYEQVAWVIEEPLILYGINVVDETIQKNAELHAEVGLNGQVVRSLNPNERTCDFCMGLAGSYTVGTEPREVYQRHDRCRCTVDYKLTRLKKYGSTFRDY